MDRVKQTGEPQQFRARSPEEERRKKEELFRKIADGIPAMYLHHVAGWGDGLRE
jgi:hypothetical protein